MPRPHFHWPTDRRLFRSPTRRKRTVFWLTLAVAIGAAGVVAALSRVPPV